MSHTTRCYNKQPIRGGPGLRGWVLSNLDDPEIVAIAEANYVFSRYRAYCMGHCHHCRDWRLRVRRRQAWKADLRRRAWYYGNGFGRVRNVGRDLDYDIFREHDPLAGLVDIWYDYLDSCYVDDW